MAEATAAVSADRAAEGSAVPVEAVDLADPEAADLAAADKKQKKGRSVELRPFSAPRRVQVMIIGE